MVSKQSAFNAKFETKYKRFFVLLLRLISVKNCYTVVLPIEDLHKSDKMKSNVKGGLK